MKRQIKLRESSGKTVATVIEGYDDLMIVFTDDTFAFLHPVNGYDSDASIEEKDYLSGPWNWCIGRIEVIAAGVLTQEESDALDRKYKDDCTAMQERAEREHYARLKAKFESGDS